MEIPWKIQTFYFILNYFPCRLPRDRQKNALDVPFRIFCKVGSFPSEIRRATVERVALPMLRTVSKSALIEFFVEHIGTIKEFIEARLSKVGECFTSRSI